MSVRLSALFFLIASLSMAYAATHASYTWPDPASGLVSARLTFASEKSYVRRRSFSCVGEGADHAQLATTDTTNKKAACQTRCDDDGASSLSSFHVCELDRSTAACQGFVYGPDADSYMCFQLAAPNHYPLAAGAFEGAFDVVWKFGAASICSSGCVVLPTLSSERC